MANNIPQSPSTSPSRRRGTGYTNINRILEASQNNMLGQTLGSGISQQAERAKETREQQTSGFQEKAQESRLGTEEDIKAREAALQRFKQPSGTTGFQDVTTEEVEAFEPFRLGKYEGPTGIEDKGLEAARTQARQAEQLGELTKTRGGKETLLRRFVGERDYTPGQQQLDALLLGQQGKQGQQELAKARRKTVGLTEQIRGGEEALAGQAEQYRREAELFGKETRGQLEQQQQALMEPIGAQVAQRNIELEKIRRFQEGTGDTSLEEVRQSMQQLGIDPKYQYLYGLNPELLRGEYTQEQFVTPESRARLLALSKLAGQPEYTVPDIQEDILTKNIQSALETGKGRYEQELGAITGEMGQWEQYVQSLRSRFPSLDDAQIMQTALSGGMTTTSGEHPTAWYAPAYRAVQKLAPLQERFGVSDRQMTPLEQQILDSYKYTRSRDFYGI